MRSFARTAFGALSALLIGMSAHAGPDIPIGPSDSIQDTIDAAPDGARILLDPGVYTQSFEIIQTGRELTIEGAGPGQTILDGENMRRIAEINENGAPITLRGMTLRNGRREGPGDQNGAALLSRHTALTVDNCVFSDNAIFRTSDFGQTFGGAALFENFNDSDLALLVIDCIFENNSAGATPQDEFEPNMVAGGAVRVAWLGAARFENCRFENNHAMNPDGEVLGGALETQGDLIVLERCVFRNNTVTGDTAVGGGVAIRNSATLSSCLLEGNEAGGGQAGGGGAYIASPFDIPVELLHCTIVNNTVSVSPGGGGVFQISSIEISIVNSIITDNTAPAGDDLSGNYVDLRHSLVGDLSGSTFTGEQEGNLIGVSPMFVDASGGDFRLSARLALHRRRGHTRHLPRRTRVRCQRRAARRRRSRHHQHRGRHQHAPRPRGVGHGRIRVPARRMPRRSVGQRERGLCRSRGAARRLGAVSIEEEASGISC
ncbi:MAG: hypothetical protein EA376_13195 [Phycisphaeraceae bacterium]|nr:MAG: hypothetical protein EA376_13195 [Phycisphaeraceae bacterium]